MGFSDGVLTADEEIVAHLRPHGKAAVRPTLVLLMTVGTATMTAVVLPGNPGGRLGSLVVGAVCLVLALVRGVWPLAVWRCTHYVFTNERILLQDGVLTRERRDLPLGRVNDHSTTQGPLERMLGCGTLTIDVIGDREPAVLVAVPGIARVQTMLYELVESEWQAAERDAAAADETTPATAVEQQEAPPPPKQTRGPGWLRRVP